jgi:hypothetical protein
VVEGPGGFLKVGGPLGLGKREGEDAERLQRALEAAPLGGQLHHPLARLVRKDGHLLAQLHQRTRTGQDAVTLSLSLSLRTLGMKGEVGTWREHPTARQFRGLQH